MCDMVICFWLCVKCVSLDTGSIPPEINPWAPSPFSPYPPRSLHPPCLLKCVCVSGRVCVRVYVGLGSACPVPQHLQGATEKTAVCWRETENVRKRESRANRHASQDRHFWSEYHHLCCSPSPLPPSFFFALTSCLFLSLFLVSPYFLSPLVRSSATLILLLSCFCNVLLRYKILGCIFSDIMHLPTLLVFMLLHQTVMAQFSCHWLCSQLFPSKCIYT